MILQDGVETSVSIKRITSVKEELDALGQQLSRPVELEETSRQAADKLLKDWKMERYAVERIIHRATEYRESCYALLWYDFSSKGDIFKPLKRLPKHFENARGRRKHLSSITSKEKKNDGSLPNATRLARSDNKRHLLRKEK